MKIHSMSLGELGTNCYIVYNEDDALIVDPGGDPEKVIDFLEHQDVSPHAILLTHAHFDHIGGVDALRKHFNIDVYLHENEAAWLEEPHLNRSTAFTRKEVRTARPDHLISPGNMKLSTFEFDVIHTPGHSPGSVSFIFKDEGFIISGDVLFQQGIGRTDLPGGSMEQLENSVRQKLYLLDDHYIVYPGHGSYTTIGAEKIHNPFIPG